MKRKIVHKKADIEFEIEFVYAYEEDPTTEYADNEKRVTQCFLVIHDVVYMAEVVRYYKDKPNRPLARKLALEKVMRDAGFDRETRTAIWNSVWESGMKKPD